MNDQVINKEKILPMVTKKGYLSFPDLARRFFFL